jgi:mono/diheme cytochrome c family protein
MRLLKLVIVVFFAAALIVGCGGMSTNNSTNGDTAGNAGSTTAAANVAVTTSRELDGKQLYIENCQICHRDTGKGGPVTVQGKKLKPADLTGERIRKRTDDDLIKGVNEGSPEDGMPAFKGKLKPDEIVAIVGYIRLLQK